MRRIGLVLLVLVIIAAACSDSSGSATTTEVVSGVETTAPGGESGRELPADFEPTLVDELVALEQANDASWTIDSAVAAIELLQPVMETGVDAVPPIDVSRLAWFLAENDDLLSDEQRAIISAAPSPEVNAALASYATADDQAAEFRGLATDSDKEFERRTGHVLDSKILVFVSELNLFAAAVVVTSTNNREEMRMGTFFATEAAYNDAKEVYREATEDGTLACVIVLGQVFAGMNEDRKVAGMMHEVAHCHQHTAHPRGPRGFFSSPEPWMDEGYASWAGEQFVGGSAQSAKYWNRYHEGVGTVGGHRTTAGSYDAIALFSYLHDNGVDGWANFREYFEEIRARGGSGPDRFEAMFGRLPTTAQAAWASSSLRRPHLSELWDYTTGPGIGFSTVAREPRQTDMGVGDAIRFSLPNGEQGTYRIQPRLGGATAALFKIEISAPSAIRWPWAEDRLVTSSITESFCLGEECVCEDGTVLGEPAPEFTESDAILATFTGAGALTASLRSPEEECEEDPEPEVSFGSCPGGEWAADKDDIVALLVTQYDPLGVSGIAHESGTATMSFFESGTYRFDYRDTTFTGVLDGQPAKMVLTGGAAGAWEATATELTVDIDDIDVQVALFIDGVGGPSGQPPGGEGGGTAAYVCAGNTLVIDPEFENPFWQYPRSWTQVEP